MHEDFLEVKSGKNEGVIRERNKWVAADGTVVCTDERTLRFYNPGRANERLMDFEITLIASNGELTFGDTKEGTMAVRLAETMRLKGKVGKGHIVNSAGVRDGQTWGKRAEWCDYYGPVEGKTVGIAIFDHPQNPRHPTWWHVRDYGLFAANPFGQHDFEKPPGQDRRQPHRARRQERDLPLSLLPARRRRAASEGRREVSAIREINPGRSVTQRLLRCVQ